MGPWISESHHTPDLLQENGYKYLMDWPMDDQPIWMKTKKGKILSIPYPVEINDAPAMLYRHHTPEQFAKKFTRDKMTEKLGEILDMYLPKPVQDVDIKLPKLKKVKLPKLKKL